MGRRQNPKPEGRNPKQTRRPKSESMKLGWSGYGSPRLPASEQTRLLVACPIFGLRISDFLRPSSFGFRVWSGSFKVLELSLRARRYAGRPDRKRVVSAK